MLDIKSYLESGNLELYAMGVLSGAEREEAEVYISTFPEVRVQLEQIELSLQDLAMSSSIQPPEFLREKILAMIGEPVAEISLPLISATSNYHEWQERVAKEVPADFAGGCYRRILQQTEQVIQMLLVSSTDFEDETHDDLQESFLILQGRCRCTVGDTEFFMEAGDYTEIPLQTVHRVEIVDKPVVAILQRVNL